MSARGEDSGYSFRTPSAWAQLTGEDHPPSGLSSGAPGRFPVLLRRTPYGKAPEEFYARHGYVTVVQDCRGRFTSAGDYYPFFNDVNDGYETVEWAARLPWSNGRVGTFGQSYPGATQYLIACHDPLPPHLQAMAPISAAADYHA